MIVHVWSTSGGLDVSALEPGRDVVLDLDPRHGLELAHGVYALDSLTPDDRLRVDRMTLEAADGWRAQVDAALTLDGVRWAWIWELEVYQVVNPLLATACGLRALLRSSGATGVQLMDTDSGSELLTRAVAGPLDIEVTLAPGAQAPHRLAQARTQPPPHTRARRAVLAALTGAGAPTVLRRNTHLVRAYWPLMDVLDRLLADPEARPAMSLQKRPVGARRQLRTALRGGWLGTPTALDRRRARRLLAPALAAIDAAPGMAVDAIELGPVVKPGFRAIAQRRLVTDAALARSVRRGLRRRPPARLLGPTDAEPTERLVGALARERGVPTMLICHGAYLLPQELCDLEHCDDAVLWSRAVAPTMTWREGHVHVMGYPLDRTPRPVLPVPAGRPPHVILLGQLGVRTTCTIDKRITAASYGTAIDAVLDRFPRARVTLRPHPAEDAATLTLMRGRAPEADVTVDGHTPIADLLATGDLLIGGTSTAILQAALAGTSAAVLNLSGFDWQWPIGGDTSVPVARSRAELDVVLGRFAEEGMLPGTDDLLSALGIGPGDPPGRIAALAVAPGPPRAPADRSAREAAQVPS